MPPLERVNARSAPSRRGALARALATPFRDLCMIAGQQHVGNGDAPKHRRPRKRRMIDRIIT
jgi:hypothetical protein